MSITQVKQIDQKYCSDCGSTISARAEICPKCGVRQLNRSESPDANHKSRLTAGILALFFGGVGIHKFYMGQAGLGFLYLVFFWTFIPGIVAFIEAIILLTTSDAAFNAKYNNKGAQV